MSDRSVIQIRRIATLGLAAAVLVAAGAAWFGGTDATGKTVPADTLFVDVRTPGEYASGHVQDAVNIPLSDLQSRLAELGPKDRPLAVYCRSGNRSAVAKRILVRAGFTRVVDLGSLADARRARRQRTTARPRPQPSPGTSFHESE